MNALLALVASWLMVLDPNGWAMVRPFQANVAVQSPIRNGGQDYFGWADWNARPQTIRVDLPAIRRRFPDGRQAEMWAACVTVHEAAHLQGHHNEELPLLYQYVCLDRLGAPPMVKYLIYQQLPGMVAAPEGTGGE